MEKKHGNLRTKLYIRIRQLGEDGKNFGSILDSYWKDFRGRGFIQAVLNLFFFVEVILLALGNWMMLEGFLQHGYYHFEYLGSKLVLSADGIRAAAAAAAAVFFLVYWFVLRKYMRGLRKHLIQFVIMIGMFLSMAGLSRAQEPFIDRFVSDMDIMHEIMETKPYYGGIKPVVDGDKIIISKQENQLNIDQYEIEYGLGWDDWKLTATVETDAAPCETAMYYGERNADNSAIEFHIPLSKLNYNYGLIVIEDQVIGRVGTGIRLGDRPATWYQKWLLHTDIANGYPGYKELFRHSEWNQLVLKKQAAVSDMENKLWIFLTGSPAWAFFAAGIAAVLVGVSLCFKNDNW